MDEARMVEVFRGDLSSVQMAEALLNDEGIETERRREHAGTLQFTSGETALVPGAVALLMVPSIAEERAKEIVGRFSEPETWGAPRVVARGRPAEVAAPQYRADRLSNVQ